MTADILGWLDQHGELAAKVLGIFVGVMVAVAGLCRNVIRDWWARRTLSSRLGAEAYPAEVIKASTRYYIRPDCQGADPAGDEDFRNVVSPREPLFTTMDRLLEKPSEHKHVIVLADSGMGKTSFLLNYYACHWSSRKRRERFNLHLLPVNADVVAGIQRVSRPTETVLFLDALDEDPAAMKDHQARVKELVDATRMFRTVVITCRSQFFPKEEEIPDQTGVLKVADTGDKKDHRFKKLYLAPFTEEQIEKAIKRRFRRRDREAARRVVDMIPELVARPLILSYLEDLIGGQYKTASDVYERIIDRWVERDEYWVNKEDMKRFSEKLAVEMFRRGEQRVPEAELEPLAAQFGMKHLKSWQLRGRSLLNRDAQSRYKFAHRSIGEYLCVRAWQTEVDKAEPGHARTELMRQFASETKDPKTGLHFCWIPPGKFMMGSPDTDPDARDNEKPQREVTIAKGFWMAVTPVTVAAYRRYSKETGTVMREQPKESTEDCPVVRVRYDEAAAYCRWAGGRLPTEQEWEYACRAGTTGSRYGPLDRIAWYEGNSGHKIHPVARKDPNKFGLYDMLGNVWEVCEGRIWRGGAYWNDPAEVRAAFRDVDDLDFDLNDLGFRCFRE
ncbi:MAG: hypothetical protein FJW39_11095 [Acidobacteria bacterium]|nr:hypothetical protein [Acidobacteriota bacterium]